MASKTDKDGNVIIGVKEHIKNLYEVKVEQTDLNNIKTDITQLKTDINTTDNELNSLQNNINNKQDKLTSNNAGDNISIENDNTGIVKINFSGNIPNSGITPEQLEQAKTELKTYADDKAQDAVDDFVENTYNDKIDELDNNITNNSNLINTANQNISTLQSQYKDLKSQVDFQDTEFTAIGLDLDNNSNDIKKLRTDTDNQFSNVNNSITSINNTLTDINNKITILQQNDIMAGLLNWKIIECTAGVVNKPSDLDFSKPFRFKVGTDNTLNGSEITYIPNNFIQGIIGSSSYDLTIFYNNGNPIIDSNGIIISRMAYTDLGNNNPTTALSSIQTKNNFTYTFAYWQSN